MTTTITATVVPSQWRVDLQVVTDAVGAATVTVRRTMAGTTRIVRGGDGGDISGGVWVMNDWEILYDTPLTHEARVFDGNGVLLETDVTDTAVTVPGTKAQLRDVLLPSKWVFAQLVGRESGTGNSTVRQSLLRPLGRSTPVVVTDVRSGVTGQVKILTQTIVEYRELNDLLASGHVLMFTGPAYFDLEWPLYLVPGDVQYERISDTYDEARLVTVNWVQVDPPPGIIPPDTRTWQELLADPTADEWHEIDTEEDWIGVIYPSGGA